MVRALICLFLLTSCSPHVSSRYKEQYAHIKEGKRLPKARAAVNDPLVIFYVAAPRLDYSDARFFLKTMMKHPVDYSLNADVGHAWVYLKRGEEEYELGHTGEFGQEKPKYLDGVFEKAGQKDPNPISYLWEEMNDGILQKGSGGHTPTFAGLLEVSDETFEAILEWIESYPKKNYGLTTRHCCTFALGIAELCGLSGFSEKTLEIPKVLRVGKQEVELWKDPKYSKLSFLTPDSFEKDLIRWAKEGKITPLPLKKRGKRHFSFSGLKRYFLF